IHNDQIMYMAEQNIQQAVTALLFLMDNNMTSLLWIFYTVEIVRRGYRHVTRAL
ncbi:hypothetical protein ACJX0J_011244, partial [Zea mays]